MRLAAQAGPAPAWHSHWCHGFCQRDNKQINIIILHRTTSAKTRATATLRQQHIPPNVVCHFNQQSKTQYDEKKTAVFNSIDDNWTDFL